MMRRILLVTLLVFMTYLAEFFLFNSLGSWFKPDFLILLVIFLNLYFGIRYSIYTAILAGILADSFGAPPFGIHIFSFVFCAYGTTFLKKYLYHMGSSAPRLLLILCVILVNEFTHFFLYLMLGKAGVFYGLRDVLWSGVFLTLLAANYFFKFLRQCVLKFCG